jgi:hypothetical protein
MHLIPVGGPAEVIMGSGRSPARPADWGLDYLLVRRAARGAQPNHFLTVIDAYQQTPVVQGVRLVSASPLTLEVQRDGAVDTLILATPAGPSRTCARRPLGLSFKTVAGGKTTKQVQIGEPAPQQGPGYAAGTIASTQYAANEILVTVPAADRAAFAAGRYLRIFNAQRSAMYRIMKATPEGQYLRLKLDQTAHLGEGPVTTVKDGMLWIGAHLVFAQGRYNEQGNPLRTHDPFAGSWLGEGKQARQLKGAVGDTQSQLLLRGIAPRADLEQQYQGKVVRIWQYGIGDQIEIARIR